MTEKTINFIKLPDGETYRVGGGSGFNLFDTKISDHILEGEEALGWALQGTYVYKEGVAGSRTGYADFYNKCVEEYQEDNNTLSAINTNITKVGVLTDNNGVLSGFSTSNYATLQNTFTSSEIDECQIVFTTGNDITSIQGLFFASISDNSSSFGILDGGLYLCDKKYGSSKTLTSLGFSLSVNTKYYFKFTQSGMSITPYLSTDGIGYTQGTTVTRSQDFGNMLGLGLSNDSPNTPYLGSIDLKECYINIGGSRWWTGADYVIQNPNGHKFYPISQKPYIDSIYESTGIADFYGVDTENERIFLPRNKYFAVTGGVKGNGMTLGLTDGSQDLGIFVSSSGNGVGAFKDTATVGTSASSVTGANNLGKVVGVNTDSTKSGITLEPNENKYLYYCVGNTKVESAISNVTEITTSENDTLPLFYNFYSKEDMTTTGAYVNASLGSWLSGNVYATAYNELVNKLGTDNVKANTDTYTDYDFVVNQDEMIFRLPLLNGDRVLVEKKEATATDYSWYNLYSDGWLEQGGRLNGVSSGLSKFTFLKPFNNDKYTIVSGIFASDKYPKSVQISTTTSTGFSYQVATEGGTLLANPFYWEASGYANISSTNINLYYKVANAVTNLELLDVANVMDEAVLRSSLVEAHVVVETYQNGSSWYRIWSDGWCEQGGSFGNAYTSYTEKTFTFLKPFKDTNYMATCHLANTGDLYYPSIKNKTPQAVTFYTTYNYGGFGNWEAKGYIS